ncbi:YwbE family protein [Marinicella meishanensis]|uniref:YwbE family protein n=1 Tax=Marinicella meishanensis TaxID=2873263 RepID=UPI001CC09A76|nr:YwbE family protein [Marinicella sp. NBU2979]
MPVPTRQQLSPGMQVAIVQKHHQRSGQLTDGEIDRILTKSSTHPHGIKVKLRSGEVGRVKAIHD